MTERYVQTQVLKALKERNFYHVKIVSASTSGHPDCIACIGGVFVAIEFKSDCGKLSSLQIYRLSEIKKNEGMIFVVSLKNLKDMLHWIRHVDL